MGPQRFGHHSATNSLEEEGTHYWDRRGVGKESYRYSICCEGKCFHLIFRRIVILCAKVVPGEVVTLHGDCGVASPLSPKEQGWLTQM